MKKKMQWGGTAESSETGEFIGGENASSMYNTGGGVDSLSKQNKEILAKELYGKKYSDCDTEQKQAIKAELELGKFSPRWNKLFKESKFSKTAYAKGGGIKTKKDYIEYLNEVGVPEHDHPENEGRVSWAFVNRYGEWLKKNDPVAFEVGYSEWKNGYAKGGGLKGKAKYVPNYMVQSVEVERKGKTTEIDGANILDGVYVKKGVKFAKGGGTKNYCKKGNYEDINSLSELKKIVGDKVWKSFSYGDNKRWNDFFGKYEGEVSIYISSDEVEVSANSNQDYDDDTSALETYLAEEISTFCGFDSYDNDYAKGGGLKAKAKYVPNYMVQSVEVERKGKTTDIDGANILDGVYVKKGVKFANGGAMNETFPENDAMSYAKGGGVSHYKVGNEIFIDYMDAVSYCDKKNLPYSKIIKTKKYEDGGSTSGWCYSIGGL